jgi:ribosomal-protein-alanine N-acetyltransferase
MTEPPMTELHTERLVLRRWQPDDGAAFAELNGDPETMTYLPPTLTRQQSDALIRVYEDSFDSHGFGNWAVCTRDGQFLGAVGLLPVGTELPFGPTVEVGWRLHRHFWHRGYATEAARRALEWAFEEHGLPEIVAFTAAINAPSRAVMTRLGMQHDPSADFLHPQVAAGDPLQPHVLYRLPGAARSA